MPRVWELLSYLRGDGEQQNQPDGKLRQMRETSLPVDPASRRELDDLHSKVAQQRQEIADLTNELSSYRTREEAAAARLADQLADCDRLKAELAEARDDLQERDRQLQLGSQQLRTRQAQVEDAQLELNQKAAELLITAQQLAKVEISAQEARSEADRLSQQVTEQNKQLVQLESQLATARLAVAAAAAAAPPPPPPPPPPPSIDPAEVEALREELASVRESLRVSEEQRMQEIHMIQEALEEALKENATLESRYRREVEQLKTVTAERETQLMDDAETRLREMQYDWKRKLEEREKAVEERAKIARKSIEDELESLRNHRRDMDIVGGEQKVTEVELLRSFEAEVVQLRGLSHELMRELRAGNRQVEVAKMAEAMAADENRRLNELVRKQNGTISSIQKELQRVQQRTDTQEHQGRAALEAQWEDRLRQERSALKAELDSLHAEEKHLAVESVRVQLEQKLNSAKQEQEQTVRRLEQELSTAREEVIQKDESHYFEIKRIKKQANSDLCALQEKLRHSYENSKPEPIVQQTKDPSPVVNGLGSESDEEEDENDNEEGDEEAEEEDFFDVEDSEAAGEEIRRQHRRDLELLLRTSQDQRADLQLMLERYEARTACTQEELRMLHAERSGPHTEAGPARRPVPGAARLAAVLTALQECGDQLVRLISARDEQRLRSVRVLVPARLRQLNNMGAP